MGADRAPEDKDAVEKAGVSKDQRITVVQVATKSENHNEVGGG